MKIKHGFYTFQVVIENIASGEIESFTDSLYAKTKNQADKILAGMVAGVLAVKNTDGTQWQWKRYSWKSKLDNVTE